jgi:hypothetical protein
MALLLYQKNDNNTNESFYPLFGNTNTKRD